MIRLLQGRSLKLGHHLLIWLFHSSHLVQLIVVARLLWLRTPFALNMSEACVKDGECWYTSKSSPSSTNNIGWTSQYLHLTSRRGDPWTSRTCTSWCSILPKLFLRNISPHLRSVLPSVHTVLRLTSGCRINNLDGIFFMIPPLLSILHCAPIPFLLMTISLTHCAIVSIVPLRIVIQ